ERDRGRPFRAAPDRGRTLRTGQMAVKAAWVDRPFSGRGELPLARVAGEGSRAKRGGGGGIGFTPSGQAVRPSEDRRRLIGKSRARPSSLRTAGPCAPWSGDDA